MGSSHGHQAQDATETDEQLQHLERSLSRGVSRGASREVGDVGNPPSTRAALVTSIMPVSARTASRAIQERFKIAHARASAELQSPVTHARLCVSGLILVQGLRILSWLHRVMPVSSVSLMHALSASADMATICCGSPLTFSNSSDGHCVRWGCLGPAVTLLVTMVVLDFIALATALGLQPYPVLPPHSGTFSVAFFKSTFGAWNCSLVASFALEVSLCACCWRIYRGLRTSGLYPPDNEALEQGTPLPEPHDVSPMEMFCESDEVALLHQRCAVNEDGIPMGSYADCRGSKPSEMEFNRTPEYYATANTQSDSKNQRVILEVARAAVEHKSAITAGAEQQLSGL